MAGAMPNTDSPVLACPGREVIGGLGTLRTKRKNIWLYWHIWKYSLWEREPAEERGIGEGLLWQVPTLRHQSSLKLLERQMFLKKFEEIMKELPERWGCI